MTGLDTVGAVIKYRCCLRGDKIYTPEKTSRNSMPSATFVLTLPEAGKYKLIKTRADLVSNETSSFVHGVRGLLGVSSQKHSFHSCGFCSHDCLGTWAACPQMCTMAY